MSFGPFRVKTVIFNQNQVHLVNMGQTMSTRVKNEFHAVSGQNRHFRPKPCSPGQYGSTRVKHEFSGRFGSKPSFSVNTDSTGSIRVQPCWPGWKMSFRLFWVKTVIFGQNLVHRVDTHRKFFFLVFQHNFQ